MSKARCRGPRNLITQVKVLQPSYTPFLLAIDLLGSAVRH